MHKKNFIKATSILLCLGILSLSAPGLLAVEKKASKSDVKVLLEKPARVMHSFFSFIYSMFHQGKKAVEKKGDQESNGSISFVKPTGELDSGRPADGD